MSTSPPLNAEQRAREAFYAEIRAKLAQEYDWADQQRHREENEKQWEEHRKHWKWQRRYWTAITVVALAAAIAAIVRVFTLGPVA
ncbi:MAG: hypothetical protein ACR2RB_08530 [Gammaproteobacteria bacterium]